MTFIIAALPGIGTTTTVKQLNHEHNKDERQCGGFEIMLPETIGIQSATTVLVENVRARLGIRPEIVFVPATADVIFALIDAGLSVNIIYPHPETVESHLKAMADRGISEEEIQTVRTNWDQYQATFNEFDHPTNRLTKLRLPKDQPLDKAFQAVRKHLVSVQ